MRSSGRLLIVLIYLFQLADLAAQYNTSSPYTRFGIGEFGIPGSDRNRAMGGLGMALRDNYQLNSTNPASYTAQDTMSFLFDFGMNTRYRRYETDSLSRSKCNINIDHIAIGFPFTRWWKSSIGISPYSFTGYNIKEEEYIPSVGWVDYLYKGTGGISKLYLGTSFEFFHRLSLGINFSYLFGAMEHEKSLEFPLEGSFAISSAQTRTVVNGFIYNLGLQYYDSFGEDFNLQFGFIYDNQAKLDAERVSSLMNHFPGQTALINDSTAVNPLFTLEQDTLTGSIVIPRNMGTGISISYKQKVLLGVDYHSQNWSEASIFDESKDLVNSSSLHMGLEMTPDREALRGYWKRMHYRLGAYQRNSYLQVQGRQLKDSGISFGLGLPFGGDKSSFNLACNMGKKGTLEDNLIQEKYVFLSFSVTLHDFWFYKRRFD
jgi:hypothetical protein